MVKAEDVHVSRLEMALINICTPASFVLTLGIVPFREIVGEKKEDYQKLVKHIEESGEIPSDVRRLYNRSICGKVILRTTSVRKYIN